MIKKFTTFLLAFAIVLSISTPKSSAAGGAIGTVVGSFAKYTFGAVTTELVLRAAQNGLETYFSKPQTKEFVENLIAEGIFSLTDYFAAGYTDQDIYDQFTNYNAQLEMDLGTSSLCSILSEPGLYSCFVPGNWSCSSWDWGDNNIRFSVGNPLSAEILFVTSSATTFTCNDSFFAPVTGDYYFYWPTVSYEYVSLSWSPAYNKSVHFTAGTNICASLSVRAQWQNRIGGHFVCSYPYIYWPIGATSADISTPSRPTSLVTPIAIQNPDQTYTVYNNITLVDEGNKVVFDPTTGESITFTDWAYDYESRTYDLTLDGGGNMTVQFGNDSITMTQGDTVTNIFYVQDSADDPGTDNPDDPDTPGTDADVSGFLEWWKNAWNGFVDRLFTVLDGGDLEVILPGEEGSPEDEEDDGWTVFDLFALIRDALWKIITGVITVVLDGFLGLVDAIASLGDFFDIYDPANPDGIFGVPGGGVELWS